MPLNLKKKKRQKEGRKRGRDKEILQKRKYKHGSGQKNTKEGKINKINKKGNKALKQLKTKDESVVPMKFLIS